jgi:hypothetical protein
MGLKWLLPIIGIASLLSACGGEGSSSPQPPIQITAPTTFTTQPTPAAPVNNVVDKQKIILGGAISANATYSFNVSPGDPNLPSWARNYVGTDYTINKINNAGMNSVVLHFNYTLDHKTDTFFRPTFATQELFLGTPDWATIETGAQRVTTLGSKPVFYMTINQLPSSWDSLLASNYSPKNPDAFFASYKELLLKIAYLSEKYNSPYMSIGVELGPVATDPKYLPYWQDIIKSVRAVYRGKLTYVSWVNDVVWQGGNGAHDYNTELDDLTFTDQIDLLGMTVFPQTLDQGQLHGTYNEFYAEWKNHIIPEYKKFIESVDKPVFIAEFGISRIDGTGSRGFWGSDVGMKLDFVEQADLMDASLRAMHEGLKLEGIVFWGGFDSTSLVNGTIDINNSYTTNWIGVPAEAIVTKWMYEFKHNYPPK